MNNKKLADVLILARGGGSLEDLWPFNEEIVARAIYESELPIISAVGHETDFTIADFVADLRAPTPSAAAELAVPNIEDIKEKLNVYELRYKQSLRKKVEIMRLRYEKCMSSRAFSDPLKNINDSYILVDNFIKRLQSQIENKIKIEKQEAIKLISKMDALSPLKTLTRGYSITSKDELVIKSVKDIEKNDEIDLRYIDGLAKAKILTKEEF